MAACWRYLKDFSTAEDNFLPPALAGRPEEYWRGILRTGVDGVFADAPERVRAVIDEAIWR